MKCFKYNVYARSKFNNFVLSGIITNSSNNNKCMSHPQGEIRRVLRILRIIVQMFKADEIFQVFSLRLFPLS